MFKKGLMGFGVLVSALALSALLLNQVDNNSSQVLSTHTQGNACGAYIFDPYESQVVDDFVDVKVSIIPSFFPPETGSTALDLSYVRFWGSNSQMLGTVYQPSGGWDSQTRLDDWDSTSVPNGPYEIYAVLNYSGQYICNTQPLHINVNNVPSGTGEEPDNHELRVFVSPSFWSSPTYYNGQIIASAKIYDNLTNTVISNVSNQANYEWSNTIGQILDPYSGRQVTFKSGPVAGTGKITVEAEFDNHVASRVVNVDVFQTNGETSGTNEETTTSDTTTGTGTGTTSNTSTSIGTSSSLSNDWSDYWFTPEPETFETTAVNEATSVHDPADDRTKIIGCVYERLGADAYRTLSEAQVRFNSNQFELVHNCFARTNFIVPTAVAPVNPIDVVKLPESTTIKVDKPQSVDKIVNSEKIKVLQLSGYAEPNKSILLYVFSDPLVLSTKTDSSGRWVYTLEEPLEPGEHEAYVLVGSEEEDGEYVRSGLFTFAITAAETTATNPNGYSLVLAEDNYQLLTYYIIGAAILVMAAALVLTRYLWTKPTKGSGDVDGVEDSSLGQSQSGSDVEKV